MRCSDIDAADAFLATTGNAFLLLNLEVQRDVLARLLWQHVGRSGDPVVMRRLLRETVRAMLRWAGRMP